MARDLQAPESVSAASGVRDLEPPPGVVEAPSAAPAQPPVTLGAGATGALHAARHLAAGLGDKIIAAEQALSEVLHDKTGQTNFGDAYSRNLAFNDKLLEDSDKAHPVARWTGNAIGVLGNAAALAALAPARAALAARGLVPAAKAAPETLSALARVLQGTKEGAKAGLAFGSVGGFGGNRSDTLGGTLFNTGLGGLAGLVVGTPLGAVGGGISALLARRAAPQVAPALAQGEASSLPTIARAVTPTPEAQTLQKYGIPLTLGQMQPGGLASEVEEATGRTFGLGALVKGQRDAAEDAWRNTVLNEARPPVPGALRPGSTIEKLEGIKGDFADAYNEALAGKRVPIAATHPQTGDLVNPRVAFQSILQDPNYQAGDQDLRIVRGVLDDQLGKLSRSVDQGIKDGTGLKASVLQDMRSGLREAAHKARLAGEYPRAAMFQDAADSVGGGLRQGLSQADRELLDATDAAYSRFAKVRDAAAKTATNVDEGEFGPKHLSAVLARSLGSRYVTDADAGGSLRELATAGKKVFTPTAPLTGHGEISKSAIGWGLGPMLYRANANPAAQAAFMEAAQRAATQRPTLLPPAAGGLEQLLSGLLQGYGQGGAPAAPPSNAAAQSLTSLFRERFGQ